MGTSQDKRRPTGTSKQIMEILEKISDQVKKVEDICSGSAPVLEGEYYNPPVSHMRINAPSKLSAPPNLPRFLGRKQYQVWKGQ